MSGGDSLIRVQRMGHFHMLKILGILVIVVGVGLWIGNVSGQFRTFPGLGYLTILIGGITAKTGNG